MLRRVVTKDCIYSVAEEGEISDDIYVTDEEELTVHYAEEDYDKIVQVDFEDIPHCPLAAMDCSIYSEIQITGADNIQPVATDSVHPNDKSISVQVVQEEAEMIYVPEELSPAALLLNDFYITDEDELTVYYAEVPVNFEDIPTNPPDCRFYTEIQITEADNIQPVATEMIPLVNNEEQCFRPEDFPENVIIRLSQDFYEYITDEEEEFTVYYVEEAYDKIVQVNIEDIPRCPLASIDSCIYSDIQFDGAGNMHPNDKSTQTDIQVARRPVQVLQEQEDLIQVVQEQEEIIQIVNNEERRSRPADLPQNIVIGVPEELSTTTASSTLTVRFVGSSKRRILSTDQLLCFTTVCIFTALGMCLIVGIGLIQSDQ